MRAKSGPTSPAKTLLTRFLFFPAHLPRTHYEHLKKVESNYAYYNNTHHLRHLDNTLAPRFYDAWPVRPNSDNRSRVGANSEANSLAVNTCAPAKRPYAPSVPAGNADSDPSAESTADTDQWDGEYTPSSLHNSYAKIRRSHGTAAMLIHSSCQGRNGSCAPAGAVPCTTAVA